MPRMMIVGTPKQPEEHTAMVIGLMRSLEGTWDYVPYEQFKPEWVLGYDLVVTFGKEATERVLGRKTPGSFLPGHEYGHDAGVPVITQHTPKSVLSSDRKSKIPSQWARVWEICQTLLNGDRGSLPEITVETRHQAIKSLISSLDMNHDFAYDYETWGDVDARRPDLCGEFRILTVGVSTVDGNFSFPLQWDRLLTAGQMEDLSSSWFGRLVRTDKAIAHSCKYEHKCNLKVRGETPLITRDTQLQAYVLNETEPTGLGAVMARCNVPWAWYKNQSDEIRSNVYDSDPDKALRYNGLDATGTMVIHDIQKKQIDEQELGHIVAMEEAFSRGLALMEMLGMKTDMKAMPRIKKSVEDERDEALNSLLSTPEVNKVEKWAADNIKSFKKGDRFNPASPVQVKRLCVDVLKLNITAVTKKKGTACDSKSLAPFAATHPIIRHLLKYRSANAMITGFIDPWATFLDKDGFLHGQFNQAIVVTGRLSSSNPNLQNIPSRGDEDNVGMQLREAFISRYPGGSMICADFIQQEPRLMAGWSGDPKMIEAIMGGLDLHGYVASEIYGVEYRGDKTEHRVVGKSMNLGIQYGQTEYGLSKKTGISEEAAKELIVEYNRKFELVSKRRYMWHREAMEKGYASDLFGGRRHLPDARSTNKWDRERALRQAGNFPIQRTAYVFCMLSMLEAQRLLEGAGIRAHVVCQVHDSLWVDSAPECRDEAIRLTLRAMRMHNDTWYWGDKGVPMDSDIKIGKSLYHMEKQK